MATPLDDLDYAFELPSVVTDAKLRSLYEVLVHRMRQEARHLPMNTVQQLLIERIATNYIVLRSKERGDLGGFAHAGVQKDYNTFWLAMTAEFNRLLAKSDAAGDRVGLLKEMHSIIVNTLTTTLPDPRQRSAVLEKMALAFENAGVS
jgi:hypothetical protein